MVLSESVQVDVPQIKFTHPVFSVGAVKIAPCSPMVFDYSGENSTVVLITSTTGFTRPPEPANETQR